MKFSYRWLQEFLTKEIDIEQLVAQLTSAGLEVDSVTPAAADFSKVVVGEIIEIKPHPNAEKLKVCLVNVGLHRPITIVTNVASVKLHMKVPVARVGAVLPDGTKIVETDLRGVKSLGMFCGADTLGLGESSKGDLLQLSKDAPIGEDLQKYLQLDDSIIDIELTPNRADCLSILGIAREAALANDCKIKTNKIKEIPASIQTSVKIKNHAPSVCPHYVARVIRSIDSHAVTPTWMREKLRRGGIRAIHPVVDVTNYVMLELGQPMHAFDLAKITGDIQIRLIKHPEPFQALDGQNLELTKDILTISDDSKVLAMAGIMGGLASSVTAETSDILLESAFFKPLAIVGKARQYGLHTESSHRFERGVDPALAMLAMRRATDLLLEIVGGAAGPIVETTSPEYLPQRSPIKLRYDRISQLLGHAINTNKIKSIFNSLGMVVEADSDVWQITPPGYRFDIAIEADLIEEVARVYGYDNIPARTPAAALRIQPQQPDYRAADVLKALDYHEVISYSFVDPKLQNLLSPELEVIALSNPISPELSVMRSTLWASLLPIAQYNANRQQARIRLFEAGLRFIPEKKGVKQTPTLAGLAMGSVMPEQWGANQINIDFYDIKADVEAVLALTGKTVEFRSAEITALHPGRSAEIFYEDQSLGFVGALHPKIQQALDLPTVYLFELNLTTLMDLIASPTYESISKYPAIRRDIAIVIDEKITAAEIVDSITKEAGKLLNNLIIFDVYRGEGITPGHKSMALGLVWQAVDRTLSDDEINSLMQKVLHKLQKQHKAVLRE